MLLVHDSSDTRSILLVAVGLIVLSGLSVVPASPSTTADQTALSQNTSDKHTLVIETTGNPVQYTISASGSINGDAGENDAVQGRTLSGRVGGVPWNNSTNDTKDTITYSGHIETFQHRGDDLQLRLDGQQISPTTLSANHLQLVKPNSTNGSPKTPINYEISVTGDATPGESTDNQDGITVENGSNGTLIHGQLSDQSDSFYFTGNTSVKSFDRQVFVFVNGRNITVSGGSNGTPTEPANSSTPDHPTPLTPSTSTPVFTMTDHTTTHQSPADGNRTVHQSPAERDGTGSSQSSGSTLGFLLRLASGVVMVALAVTAVWYYLPGQQRW